MPKTLHIKPHKSRTGVILLMTGVAAAVAAILFYASVRLRVRGTEIAQSGSLLAAFIGQGPEGLAVPKNRQLTQLDFDHLAQYFVKGFISYRDPEGSSASYPGLPSSHGAHVDGVEGFARMAPLLAVIQLAKPGSAQATVACRLLVTSWTAGADPHSAGYWGTVTNDSQLICEASDIALSLWLGRSSSWLDLTPRARANMIRRLRQVNEKAVPDNNWHLFVTFTNLVVRALGFPADMREARIHYLRFKSFGRGDGWFSDGPASRFDYYNAWGMDHQLFWIYQVAPDFDPAFIPSAIDAFAAHLQYLVGPTGFPILGRSICYRLAVVSPLILDQVLPTHSVSTGIARRALAVTWRYFIRHGAVRNGHVIEGYCGSDGRLIDRYSGPASCLWSLRSLISALYVGSHWSSLEEPLPVERAAYRLHFPQPGWTVIGTPPDTIEILKAGMSRHHAFSREVALLAFYDRLAGKSHRPENEDLKYGLAVYRSDRPFCGCSDR